MEKEIVRKYEDIKESVEGLKTQLSDITALANKELREYGEEAMDEVSTNVKKAVEGVRENPWTTVAVVSITALVLGALFGATRSSRK